jgi:calcineurin-like phosphoesterase family protein
MSDTFVIADLHLGHKGMVEFVRADGSKLRPFETVEEHDNAIIGNWVRTVKPQDKVYVLGDVAFKPQALRLLERLPGDKVLIKGNHDTLQLSDYRKVFRDVRATHILDRVLLTHIPIHPGSLSRWAVNVHGHLHYQRVMLNDQIDPRYLCVSCEHINYTPLEWGEMKKLAGL